MGCGASTSNVVPLVETRDHTAHKDQLVGAEPITAQSTQSAAPRDRCGNSKTRPASDSRLVAESPPATPPHEPVADVAALNATIGDVLGGTHSMATEGRAARSDSIGDHRRYRSQRTASLRISATLPPSHGGYFGATTDLQRMPTRLPPLERQSKASFAGLPPLVSSAPANGRRAVSEARLSAALAACSHHEDRSVPDLKARAGRRNRLTQTTDKSAEDEALKAQIFATKLEFIESRRASSSQQDQPQQQREQNVVIRW